MQFITADVDGCPNSLTEPRHVQYNLGGLQI